MQMPYLSATHVPLRDGLRDGHTRFVKAETAVCMCKNLATIQRFKGCDVSQSGCGHY